MTLRVAARAVQPAVAADFALSSNTTLTITAGQIESTGIVTVDAEDNTVDAPDKTVDVSATVTAGPTGMPAPATQTLTITDDEGTPTVTLVLSPDQISEDDGVSTVTARLNRATSEAVTVKVMAAGEAGAFELSTDTDLTIAANSTESTGTVTVAALDNEIDGPNKQVTVTGMVTGPEGMTAPVAETLTIVDDEGAPTVTLLLSPDAISENRGVSTVKASLSGATSAEVTVQVSAEAVSPAGQADFTLSTNRTLTIKGGDTASTGTVTVTGVDDTVGGPSKQVTVSGTVTGPDGVTPPAPKTLTIEDDEAPAAVSLEIDPAEVGEGDGETDVTVTATLVGAIQSVATTVTVSVDSGTAIEGTDFQTVQDFTLTIEANHTTADDIFTLILVDDTELEESETVEVRASAGAVTVTQFITIADNDSQSMQQKVKLSMEGDSEWVMEGGGPKDVTIKAELTGDHPRDVETRVDVLLDPYEASPDDYETTGENFEIVIPKDTMSNTHTFMFKPMDDDEEETDENVQFNGDTGEPDLPVDPTTLMIKDNDGEDGGGRTNEPPDFLSSRYTFDLPEHRDGRETPVRVGGVSARDPEGEAVRYALASGDASRFALGSSNGSITYVGPGEDYEAGPRRYELQVTARDDDRLTVRVTVIVRVTDMPEAPVAADDAAETPEDEQVVVDVLANDRDPDGDRLRLTAVTAPAHGTATIAEGRVRYEPTLNYHGADEFRYTVADPGGLTATATVTVTVTPVNDPPDAVDDEAETLEDEALVVDVLANDTDPDGDPLRIVSATAPAHGTATPGAGGVRYAPALNYHGQDSFDYTIADPGGLTDTATVTVTVLPVNDAPEAVGVIPDQPLEEGGEPVTLDLALYFTDVDGDVLTYTAESSNPAATAVTVSGSTLTLSAVVRGAATVTVTATDPDGLTATQVFGVSVGDRLVREVLTDTLAALGRGHLSSVRQTVGRRLETGGMDTQRLTLAGQAFGPEAWDRVGSGSLAQTHDLLFRAATLQQRANATDMVGTSADPRLRQPGSFTSFGGFSGDWDQALPATDILMAFGGDDASTEEPTGDGTRWTVWGQGDMQTFRGTPEPVKGYEGDLRTGYLGVDAQVTRHWLLGVAMARSGGSGTWQRGASAGELSTTLTRVHPYVRWADGDTAVWGVLGVGRGNATHVRTLTGMGESSPLSLGLGLLEGRRRVATVGRGFDIGVRAEASWAHLATGGGDETIDDLAAGVRRVRGGVEVTRALSGPGGLTLTPFGAVSTGHDGGAGQTGVGLEVAGGLRLRGGRVQLEAQGRRLVLHSATAYEEQGVSLAAMVGSSPYEPGLTLSLRPTWGAAGMGAETLWQDQIQSYMPDSAYDQTGMDARLGYGLRLGRDGLLTPFGSYGQRQNSGRRLQVGTLVGTLGQTPGSVHGPFQIELSGERYDRPGGNADHRFSMFGVINLGGSPSAYDTTTGIDPRLHDPTSDLLDVAALQDADLPAPATDVAPVDETATPALVNAAAVGEAMPAVALAPAAVADTPVAGAAPIPDALPATANAESVPAEADRFLPDAVALQGAQRSTAAAREPASEFLAPVKATRAARSGRSGSQSNRPPVFSAPSYAFETPSLRDSGGKAAPLGVVLARDPDRDPLTYSLTAGDWTRFEVEAASGAITYLGPDLPGTRRYELRVTARDTGRLTETARVVVTVASVPDVPRTATTGAAGVAPTAAPLRGAAAPRTATARPAAAAPPAARVRAAAGEPRTAALPASVARSIAAARAAAATRSASAARPAAAAPRGTTARAAGAGSRTALADAARTYAGVPVLIDVLENDADIAGMRIVDVTAPAHGTTTVTDGVVRYAPALGHSGRDTFTYTVVGEDGRTARASVTVLVVG